MGEQLLGVSATSSPLCTLSKVIMAVLSMPKPHSEKMVKFMFANISEMSANSTHTR